MPKHRKVKFQPQTKRKRQSTASSRWKCAVKEMAVTAKASAVAPQVAVKAPVAEAVAVPVEKPGTGF